MIDKVLLTGAFEKLGPERVERMLLAFGPDGETLSYCRCALGYAAGYGAAAPGQVQHDKRQTRFATGLAYLAHRLGISLTEAGAIEDVHMLRVNLCGKRDADEFVALANEWLENRPAPRDTVVETQVGGPREPAHV